MAAHVIDGSEISDGQRLELDGDWTITGTIPENVIIHLTNGSLVADDTDSYVTITVSNGNLKLKRVGWENKLDASGSIEFTSASKYLQAKAKQAISFETVDEGSQDTPVVIEGSEVHGKSTGTCTHVTAINGNIDLGRVGWENKLDAAGSIKFTNASRYLRARANQAISFETVDDGDTNTPISIVGSEVHGKSTGSYTNITTSSGNIQLGHAGWQNRLVSAGDITLGTSAKYLRATAEKTIRFTTLEDGDANDPVVLCSASVQGEKTGSFTHITAENGDIRLRQAGWDNRLEASGDIMLGESRKYLNAKAGNTIYYETLGDDHTLEAPNKVPCKWEDMPLPAEAPTKPKSPTTTINQAVIIERQRKAALEDGQGI